MVDLEVTIENGGDFLGLEHRAFSERGVTGSKVLAEHWHATV
jgi:hypothetical protein